MSRKRRTFSISGNFREFQTFVCFCYRLSVQVWGWGVFKFVGQKKIRNYEFLDLLHSLNIMRRSNPEVIYQKRIQQFNRNQVSRLKLKTFIRHLHLTMQGETANKQSPIQAGIHARGELTSFILSQKRISGHFADGGLWASCYPTSVLLANNFGL